MVSAFVIIRKAAAKSVGEHRMSEDISREGGKRVARTKIYRYMFILYIKSIHTKNEYIHMHIYTHLELNII